jgi:hypothetical protein
VEVTHRNDRLFREICIFKSNSKFNIMDYFLGVVGVMIVFIWYVYHQKAKLRDAAIRAFIKLPDRFKQNKWYMNPDGQGTIAIDATNQQVYLGRRRVEDDLVKGLVICRTVGFNGIIRADMIVDGQEVSSKSAGGALVGGLMFGIAGAVVGSNTGKTKYRKEVKSVKLRLVIRDLQSPTFDVVFYQQGSFKVSAVKAQEECEQWLNTIIVAVDMAGAARVQASVEKGGFRV